MESFEITFKFPDARSCAGFSNAISKQDLEQDEFSIALPDSKFNSDNELFSFLVTFFAKDGLEAVTAVAKLVKTMLELTFGNTGKKHIENAHDSCGDFEIDFEGRDGKFIRLRSNMTASEIRDLLNANIFQRQRDI